MSQHICIGCKGAVESDGMIPVGWSEYRLCYKNRPDFNVITTGIAGKIVVCMTCSALNGLLEIFDLITGGTKTVSFEPIASNDPVACPECTGMGAHLNSCSNQ